MCIYIDTMAVHIEDSKYKNILLVNDVYEQWMKVLTELGISHSDLAVHLLTVHEKLCAQCCINREKSNETIKEHQKPETVRTKSRRKPLVVMARKKIDEAPYSEDLDGTEYGENIEQFSVKLEAPDYVDEEESEGVIPPVSNDLHIPVPTGGISNAQGPTPLFISKVRPVTPPRLHAGTEQCIQKEDNIKKASLSHETEPLSQIDDTVVIKEEPKDYDEQDSIYNSESHREEIVPRMIMFNNEILNVQNDLEMSSLTLNWTEEDLKKERQRMKWREERRKQRSLQKEKNTPEQEEERKRRERERMRNYRAKLNPDYKAMIRERDRERIKRRRLEMSEDQKLLVRQRNAAQKRIKRKLAKLGLNSMMPELNSDGVPLSLGIYDLPNTSLNSSYSGIEIQDSSMSTTENDFSNDSYESNTSAVPEKNLPATSFADSFTSLNTAPKPFSAIKNASTQKAFTTVHDTQASSSQADISIASEKDCAPYPRPLLPQALNALPVAFPTFVNSSEISASPVVVSKGSL